jgi:cytochrome c oxidase subunit 3
VTQATASPGEADHDLDEDLHEHFEDLPTQAHAARLGLWVFLASEVLLFGALFALFISYRAHYGATFHVAVLHNTKVLGSLNTGVLLTSSLLVAYGVHALRAGRTKLAGALTVGTICLGGVFLAIKLTEYGKHFEDGIYPGGVGSFFVVHRGAGMAEFWTMYYAMTGLHAIHVTVGLLVLGALLIAMWRGGVTPRTAHRLELGATYWHLVDLVWIFLWPLFYLA